MQTKQSVEDLFSQEWTDQDRVFCLRHMALCAVLCAANLAMASAENAKVLAISVAGISVPLLTICWDAIIIHQRLTENVPLAGRQIMEGKILAWQCGLSLFTLGFCSPAFPLPVVVLAGISMVLMLAANTYNGADA